MSEVGLLFRSVLLLCLSPAFILIFVFFSPLIVTLLLFFLGIAGLARWRRKFGRQRSRRRRKKSEPDSSSELECEKQNRVLKYLEDQLKNLEELNLDSSAPFNHWDFQFSDSPRPASCPPNLCEVRSDVSEIGENSDEESEAWSDS